MRVAAIVLNYNSSSTTIKYVNNIKQFNIINKIIVIDNDSSVQEKSLLKSINDDKIDVIYSNDNLGYARGNNYGIKYLEDKYGMFDYLIISNPDVEIKERAIIKSIHVLELNDSYALSSPRMYRSKERVAYRSAWRNRSYLNDISNSTRITKLFMYHIFKQGKYLKNEYLKKEYMEVDVIAGSFFVIKHEIFKNLGYFDENTFLYYEEDILGAKLKKAGYKEVLLNKEKYIHYGNQTLGSLKKIYKKQNELCKSKKYFQRVYNGVSDKKIKIFDILLVIKKIELLIEQPIRNLIKF